MRLRLAGNVLLGISLLFLYVVSYNALLVRLATDAGATERYSSGIWNLPDTVLHIIAGEFKGLMADYLTLEAAAQLGTEVVRTQDGNFQIVEQQIDWPTVSRLFTASQALDPSFAQTYMLAQGWLPWEAGMVNETQEMLQTSAENRPWDWRPTHFLGFNTYYFLKKSGEAGKLFLKAAKTPGAPPFLSILGARLAQKGGETEAAIALMKSVLINKPESDPGYADIVDRLHALEGVLVIEQAVQHYEKTYGHKPVSLEELLSSGILVAPPENPYHVQYCLDKTGAVLFDALKCPQ
jgi:tetratricopeptide (TPR) repeat protein